MKKIRSFIAKSALIVLGASSFVSCQEDELHSNELFVFMRNWSESSFTVIQEYSADGNLIMNGQEGLKLPLFLTREAVVDVSAGVFMDESLVETYNAAHKTTYAAFPQAGLAIGENVTIAAGSLRSADSLLVQFHYDKVMPGEYLLPLRVGKIESADKGIQGSSSIDAGVVYYCLSVQLDNIDNVNFEPVVGTKVARTGWTITCSDNPNVATPITNLIDGNRNTDYIGTKNVLGTIAVDMGQEQELKGLSFYHAGAHYGAPSKFQVYTSLDGQQWIDHGLAGKYLFSALLQNKEYGVNFTVPVTCRYFKLKLQEANFSSFYPVRFAELDAIK